MTAPKENVRFHTIAVLVDNEPGILARVVGLFSGRGYNIESLTVAQVNAKDKLSRITVVTSGTPMVIEQIKAQLARLVPVHKVHDLTLDGPSVERELALIKVASMGEKRVESLRIADIFRARAIDSTNSSFVFEISGSTEKINAFIELMRPLGLADVSRTGGRRHCARRRTDLRVCPEIERRFLRFVMPGLDPGIHVFGPASRKDVDRRVKPGDDVLNVTDFLGEEIPLCASIMIVMPTSI